VDQPPQPLPDPVTEALRLIAGAEERGVTMRAIGGVAFSLQSPNATPRLARTLKDVDMVVPRGSSKATQAVVSELGYVADEMFNVIRGASRLLFYDEVNGRHLDVFVGTFSLCHELPVSERLDRDPLTIPREELMLTKLQIFQLTVNDITDLINLLLFHDMVDSGQDAGIDAAFIAELCARDWGLWRTTTQTIARLTEYLPSAGLTPDEEGLVASRLAALSGAIESAPKSIKWRVRSRVGDRKKWYQEPSEE
jgi:hypothetical protein